MNSDGKVVIECTLNTKSFDAQIKETEAKLNDIKATLDMGEENKNAFSTSEMRQMRAEAEKLENRLVSLNTQKAKVEQIDLNNVEQSMRSASKSSNSFGKSLSDTIKKVGRWALAVFGVRTAYNAVRKAVSVLSQYDSQLSTDIEYIQYALAKAVEPVVKWIVNLAYQLLGTINQIAQSIFNINLFANASASSFQNAKKEATALKNVTAGFDELNTVGSPSTDLSTSNPLKEFSSFDVKTVGNVLDKVSEMFRTAFDKIKENIRKVLLDLGISEDFISMWEMVFEGIKNIVVGIFDTLSGIIQAFLGLVTGNTEAFKDGIEKIFKGLGEVILGLFSFWGGAIGEVLAVIKNVAISTFTTIKDKLTSIVLAIVNFTKDKFNTVKDFFSTFGTKVGDAFGAAFKTAINGALKHIETLINVPINAINGLLSIINKVPGVNISKIKTFSLPRLAVGGVINQPGRGVNYGGANIGERGAEGVIPLTNSQMMAELGETIGKYITINANITNTMNGRVISRELQKINSSSDFAYNR